MDDAEVVRERHYGSRRVWGGRANPLLVEVAGPLRPGSALDRGPDPRATVTDNVLLVRRSAG